MLEPGDKRALNERAVLAIERALMRTGMTRRQFANELDVHPNTLDGWTYQGRTVPAWAVIAANELREAAK